MVLAATPVTAFAVVGFGVCSSVMLVINKVAITQLPAPGFILFLQCALTAVGIRLSAAAGQIEVDPLLHPRLLRAFAPVAAGFLATLYCNSKALQYLNVETFIVCRCAACPCLARPPTSADSSCAYRALARTRLTSSAARTPPIRAPPGTRRPS
jgi:hypothetical protein